MSDDQFRAWRWDREDKAANAQALVLYKAGHTIRCDHHGLLVDGRRLDATAIYEPLDAKDADRLDLAGAPVLLDVDDDGVLVYRGRALVRLTPGGLELIEDAAAPAGRGAA
ncbi:hypothetical protein ABZ135_32665 [Streptomyces sp. NPDC006339]|uniref:hypothetical protein n=1 Tax=Streptomyces sp. NPDC006339 TaxID=3156755 RepID=UPI0033A08F8E